MPALDGLRGIAVLLVFFFHVSEFAWTTEAAGLSAGIQAISHAGRVGVDLFFVLSGFLITGILYDTRESPSRFRTFYARRTLRIFPLYYFALITLFLASLALSSIQTPTSAAQIFNWTYTSNFQMAGHGWDAQTVATQPFWSLAVEEQFYLLWAPIVFLSPRRFLLAICFAGIVAAFVVRLLLIGASLELGAYMLLPARMDALLIGAVIALAPRSEVKVPGWLAGRRNQAVIAIAALVLIAMLRAFVWQATAMAAAKSTLIAIGFGVVLVAALGTGANPFARAMELPLLRFFGRYSYSIYVFHVAVIVCLLGIIDLNGFSRTKSSLPALLVFSVIALAVTVLVALITWNIIEKHFIAMQRKFPYRRPLLR